MPKRRVCFDTETFHYHNQNPKNRITGDCMYRALSTALDIPYNDVVMEVAVKRCETGYSGSKLIDLYLKSKGWVKQKQPRKYDNTKFTGKEFCEYLQRYLGEPDTKGLMDDEGIMIENQIVANIGGNHIVAIIDGKVWDIWNSTDGCIGNYWVKAR